MHGICAYSQGTSMHDHFFNEPTVIHWLEVLQVFGFSKWHIYTDCFKCKLSQYMAA